MPSKKTYKITVQGLVDSHWSDYFNGTEITLDQAEGENPLTILKCQVRDQSELYGILSRLSSLNLILLEVTIIRGGGGNHYGSQIKFA